MKQVDLAGYDNSHFHPGGKLRRALWYFVSMVFFQGYAFPFSGMKVALLRMFGGKVGSGVVIKPNVQIKYPWFLQLGDHCWIGERVWVDNLTVVTLERNVCLSQGAMLLTGNHNYKKPKFDLEVAEIYLEDGVWIGARALVCPGVRCGSHAVLGAGSVASTNLQSYTVYAGHPAVALRKRILE